MLTDADVEAAADDLLAAEADRQQIGLLSLQHAGMTLDKAHRIQATQMARKLAEGRSIVG